MALDFNSIKFILWSKNLGVSFNRTLTLGRQGIGMSCSRSKAGRALRQFGIPATEAEVDLSFARKAFTVTYADEFLKLLGAKEVVTVDHSDFEDANLLHDLNQPFPDDLKETFDLVIDGGTLEHVFDYPKALSNCLDLLRVGGHIISITPASGQMGHGFYQFSPELFFRVFSEERGFVLRKIIGFDVSRVDSPFYEIQDPAKTQQRTTPVGSKPIQLAVLAQRVAKVDSVLSPPQQSDYVAIWQKHEQRKNERAPGNSDSQGYFQRLRRSLNHLWPSWLRDLRNTIGYRYRWTMSKFSYSIMNQKHFRRMAHDEIVNERSKPM